MQAGIVKRQLWLFVLLFFYGAVHAANVITDIRVDGLERVSKGAVYSNFPLDVGDSFDALSPERVPELVRSLYKSGLFDDIAIGQESTVLVIKVKERPAIADISFEGNKDIETDKLVEALKQAGIAKGQVFNRSVLQEMDRELEQQYFARGKYNVKVDTDVEPLENNRVDIKIMISEGVVTRIKRVNIIGNKDYSDDELMDDFNSGVPAWWAFLSSKDEYSKPKLAGDLEILRSHYLDRGYLNFNIDSTQVTITPDKKDIYVAINIAEGEKYKVSDVQLSGGLILPEKTLMKKVTFETGDIFSRAEISRSSNALKELLGSEGYAFADVNVIPEINEETHEVALNLRVVPGKRVYVRRINFFGNSKTRDEVLRREMRQMEGGWYSSPKVKRSKVRIQRLAFVESVNVERKRVPGRDDQVDLDITVSERFAGSFSANLGLSQTSGLVYGFSLNQDNAFGSGKRVGIQLTRNNASDIYSLSYTNPYYTIDGVSRGFNAFYRTTDAAENNVSSYLADRWGLGVNYGIPLTEFDYIRFNLSHENTKIKTTSATPAEINGVASDDNGIDGFLTLNGDDYGLNLLSSTYTHDTRDRTIFPNAGNYQRLRLEATAPGSDLDYYKVSYKNAYYYPLNDRLTFSLAGDVAYGDAYKKTSDLPFFEKFYAGGIRSVRGYKTNTLGPLTSTDRAFGGNFRVLANAQFLFPAPFAVENRSIRMGTFVDAGNVFARYDDFDSTKLRLSYGLSFEWLAPIGPLTFSLAKAFNEEKDDELQDFQFSIGGAF